MLESNGLGLDDLISVLFTVTSDISSEFPAVAGRQVGLVDIPQLCAMEIDVPAALPRVVRMMLHTESERARSEDPARLPAWGCRAASRSRRRAMSSGCAGPVRIIGTGLVGTSIGLALGGSDVTVQLVDAAAGAPRWPSGSVPGPARRR